MCDFCRFNSILLSPLFFTRRRSLCLLLSLAFYITPELVTITSRQLRTRESPRTLFRIRLVFFSCRSSGYPLQAFRRIPTIHGGSYEAVLR